MDQALEEAQRELETATDALATSVARLAVVSMLKPDAKDGASRALDELERTRDVLGLCNLPEDLARHAVLAREATARIEGEIRGFADVVEEG